LDVEVAAHCDYLVKLRLSKLSYLLKVLTYLLINSVYLLTYIPPDFSPAFSMTVYIFPAGEWFAEANRYWKHSFVGLHRPTVGLPLSQWRNTLTGVEALGQIT